MRLFFNLNRASYYINKKNILYIMERLIDICKSSQSGINIWFIINGVRPAYWLDSYSHVKMEVLLEELKKYKFIGYKFLEEHKKKKSKYGTYFPEGTFFISQCEIKNVAIINSLCEFILTLNLQQEASE